MQSRDLGASPAMAGVIGSVYGALQLVSSPLMGQWSDAIGHHFSLCVCLALSGINYMLLALAASVTLLLVIRIPHDLWDLFLIKFLAGFSVLIFRTNFTMVLKQKFAASPKTIGYTMSYSD
nr:hypothetical protein BaRGS_022779 [Batillaria attramentaria]